MDRAAAIDELPEAYASAIRLADDGAENEAIAEQLGIAVEAVGPLLRLADAKLSHVLTTPEQVPPPSGATPSRRRSTHADEEDVS